MWIFALYNDLVLILQADPALLLDIHRPQFILAAFQSCTTYKLGATVAS